MEKLTILILYLFSSAVFGQTNLENLTEDVTFLASDARNGRKTGSEEALESARFIAGKFKSYGLVSPEFATDYLQEFTLIQSVNTIKDLTLNEMKIEADHFVVLTSRKQLHITNPDNLPVIFIGPQDDFMTKFSEINGLDTSFVVLIHPMHRHRFERLKNYLTRPRYHLENDEDQFSVWILSSDDSIDQFSLNAINRIDKIKGHNVIGVLPADEPEDRIWMYSAHYDHIGYLPKIEGDSIANGANDDASGTAAVIELARIFSREHSNQKSLWFVAFDAEELGMFGSAALAAVIDPEKFEGVINIEMIGLPNIDLGHASAFISGYNLSDWPAKMAASVNTEEFVFFPDPYPNLQLFTRSDNYSFARLGIAAHTISTYFESDETYHQVSDELENIDFENMKIVIDQIYYGSLPLLQKDYDPGVINFEINQE